MQRRDCEGCGDSFVPSTNRQRFHSNACRAKAYRARKATVVEPVDSSSSDLVRAVRRDLEAAGAIDSFAGQLALRLAAQLVAQEESGVAGLSRELRTTMTAAIEAASAPEPPEVDEVAKARTVRELKTRMAGEGRS